MSLLDDARAEAAKAVAEVQEEKSQLKNHGVEVHPNVICDCCSRNPIIGPRYKSLEQEDFDLCETCFAGTQQNPSSWEIIRSEVRGDVIGSYYADSAQSEL